MQSVANAIVYGLCIHTHIHTDDAIGTDPNGTLTIGTDSNETLTSVALSFISCNLSAVLISSSVAHQAAKTVQRCIRRFLGSTDTARKRAVAVLQQHEDRLDGTCLGRLRAIQTMCMNSRTAQRDRCIPTTINSIWFVDRKPYRIDSRRSCSTAFQSSCVLIKR